MSYPPPSSACGDETVSDVPVDGAYSGGSCVECPEGDPGSSRRKGFVTRLLRLKFLRFLVVGAANSLIYAIATATYIAGLGVPDTLASALGYTTVLPFAFLVHRGYTFDSRGKLRREFVRFFLTHATGLSVSVGAMGLAVGYLGLHYFVGIAAAVVLVPVVTFLVMDRWVFVDQAAKWGD